MSWPVKRFSGNAKQRRVKRRRYERFCKAMDGAFDRFLPAFTEMIFTPLPLVKHLRRRIDGTG